MAFDYPGWITTVATIIEYPIVTAASAQPSSNDDFNIWVPNAISYAENRIYRELDLLSTRVTDATGQTVANTRLFPLPTSKGNFIVLEQVKITFNGQPQPPLFPVSKDALEAMWPFDVAPSVPSVPTMWCPLDQKTILLAPAPDDVYDVECFGTIRPAPLSATNTTTFLTDNLWDLFFAATMVSWCGFLRDYGQQADDPKLALSWETAYQTAFKSADAEELRKKLMEPGGTAGVPPRS